MGDLTRTPGEPGDPAGVPGDWPGLLRRIREATPARVLVGRAGPSYRTSTLLELRQDHAAALDAVRTELDLGRDLGREFVERWGLFEAATRARSKDEYLARPDLGRDLADHSVADVLRRCAPGADLQVAIGDGLSSSAVAVQVPRLLPALEAEARRRAWTFGQPFVIRHCRVGILNAIGDRLDPVVAVLLIGERPGLATAESLSAYMAYRPRAGHNDSHRNLISNIHDRGVPPDLAAPRIIALAERLRQHRASGVAVKECGPPPPPRAELPGD
jgi:ethanolamine ammonia-lyase small subunit